MCFLQRESLLSAALSQDESDGGSAGMSGVRSRDRQSRTALCCLEIHRAGPLRSWLAGRRKHSISHHQATDKLRSPWAGGAQLWLPTSPAQARSLLLQVRWWINVDPLLLWGQKCKVDTDFFKNTYPCKHESDSYFIPIFFSCEV